MLLRNLRVLLIPVFAFINFQATLSAQTGSISGVVTDKKNGETLVGANVIIVGTYRGTTTDLNGHFTLNNLQPGTYELKISYISYKPVIIKNITVEPKRQSNIKAFLEEVSTSLGDVTVTATRRTGSNISLINTIRNNPIVVNGIAAQQIGRTLDKDASEVIRRIPGVSLLSDRFVVIRGLSPRYNNVWVNGAYPPSSESDGRAFSFDIIPSSMIDNILVAKSPAPELPADFSGGFVRINTKNMPQKNFLTIGYATGYNTQTAYGSFMLTSNYPSDRLAMGAKKRSLPSDFPSSLRGLPATTLAQLGQSLSTRWIPKSQTGMPEQKFSVGFGRKFKHKQVSIGTITTFTYGNRIETDRLTNRSYQVQQVPGTIPDYTFSYTDSIYRQTVKIGLLHSWTFVTGSRRKIVFQNILNLTGDNRSTIRNGWNGNDGNTIRSYQDSYTNRLAYFGQLTGNHRLTLLHKHKINWVLGFSLSKKHVPDLKQLRTTLQDEPVLPHYGQYFASVGLTPSVSDAGRVFMKLNDYAASAGIQYKQNVSTETRPLAFKFGIYSQYRRRTFNARILGFAKNSSYTESVWLPAAQIFSRKNINTSPDGFIIKETTSKSDSYNVSEALISGYMALSYTLSCGISLYGGLRIEADRTILSSYDRYNRPVSVDNRQLDYFPSLHLSYRIDKNSVIKGSFGLSVNRPEFREIAPFYFYSFDKEAELVGNPELKNAYIQNYDLRWETYPGKDETVSIGLFHKIFSSSIESVFRPSGGRPIYSYSNSKSASSSGIEVEIRKSLQFVESLRHLFIAINATYIYSRVTFTEGSIYRNRAMQGQSPYLVNIALFYNNPKQQLNLTLQYNLIGDRIISVGLPFQDKNQDIPDVKEKHRHLLDISLNKQVGKLMIKAGVKNLLNQSYVLYQNFRSTNNSPLPLTTRRNNSGITFTLGLALKLTHP